MSVFDYIILATMAVAFLAVVYIAFVTQWICKQEQGTATMRTLSQRIADGAVSFLRTEYRYIAVVVGLTSVALWLLGWCMPEQVHSFRVVNYIVGAVLSMLAGFIGMRIATTTNVRTTEAARRSLPKAFRLSFMGGTVMGMSVVAFALLGMVGLLLLSAYQLGYGGVSMGKEEMRMLLEVLTGFALGTETIALFARVAGGIYTKAADVGADIVGKVEAGIPEDDPRNPATIADNVGDNVGDIAGMGADLFGSYISTLLAAMVLGLQVTTYSNDAICLNMVMLPIAIGALGLLVCLVISPFVCLRDEGSSIQWSLNVGNIGSMVGVAVLAYPLVYAIFPEEAVGSMYDRNPLLALHLYGTVVIGLVAGLLVSWVTEYFTSMKYGPVEFIAKQSRTGAATNLIAGLSIGMFSTVVPMIIFAAAIVGAFKLASFYGVAIAAVSMMSTTAMQLAIDAFGPIADNAGGIAEMSKLPSEVRKRTDALDAVGNTTAASGKGFAIASAALTSLALFVSFNEIVTRRGGSGLTMIKGRVLFDASTLAGLFLGAMVPFLFSGLVMNAVGVAAMAMVTEVRRQFRTIPGIMEGKGMPDYERCIGIATRAALRQMIFPGMLALVLPVVVGVCFGAQILLAFLAGIVVVGTVMALFQCNAGGAWDNAKKLIEQSKEGAMGKGSEAHCAAVVGDTVGDPFKDTSGPAMNILIKLTIIVALVIATCL